MDVSSPCVIWQMSIHSKGYGQAGHHMLAHRLAYEAEYGSIPDGFVIDHACHNADVTCHGGIGCQHRRCVNPKHLELVTLAENNRRGRVNATKTHCKHGHAFDAGNTYIAKRGSRECRACNAARFRARKFHQAAAA